MNIIRAGETYTSDDGLFFWGTYSTKYVRVDCSICPLPAVLTRGESSYAIYLPCPAKEVPAGLLERARRFAAEAAKLAGKTDQAPRHPAAAVARPKVDLRRNICPRCGSMCYGDCMA